MFLLAICVLSLGKSVHILNPFLNWLTCFVVVEFPQLLMHCGY